jgi:hypothetical protein
MPGPDAAYERYLALRIRRWAGFDHEHRPVMFERLGEFLKLGNASAFEPAEWLRFYIPEMEAIFDKMRIGAESSGTTVRSHVYCADCEGIATFAAVRNLSAYVGLIKQLAGDVERFYPEIVSTILLFNTPAMFAGLFDKVIRPWMDPTTASKIEIHAGVPMKRMLQLMPPSAVPIEYGGTSTVQYPRTVPARDYAATTSRTVIEDTVFVDCSEE